MTKTFWYTLATVCALCANLQAAGSAAATAYAQDLLTKAGRNDVELRVVKDLGHNEAFRVRAGEGLSEFRNDLKKQRAWLNKFSKKHNKSHAGDS